MAIEDLVEGAVTYPILTKEVSGSGRSGRSGDGSAPPDGGSLTRMAQGAMRDLLGWRFRADDPKGFLAALNKAVNLKEVEGHIEFTWNARPLMVQADLGEVTGAQASLYERARVAVEHVLPLLDALRPLACCVDPEGADSVRALVRVSLSEIVTEFGRVSGPRIQRVDDFFVRLMANPAAPPPADLIEGALGRLRDRFGLLRDQILTVDDERNFTNYLILVECATSLRETWRAQIPFIDRNSNVEKFLGTQLVRLSQALNVVVESVREAYDAMDSVFFGPDEREVAVIRPGDDQPPITVAELLSWVEHFAGVEARQLIADSGKDGVNEVAATLEQLTDLVDSAVQESEASSGDDDDEGAAGDDEDNDVDDEEDGEEEDEE